MARSAKRARAAVPVLRIEPRLRITLGPENVLGPGKVELLERVEASGSIGEAARGMGMSYMRAWTLVKSLERGFPEPLVTKVRGGTAGGGSRLSETGRAVVRLYREMEAACDAAAREPGTRLAAVLGA